MKGEPSRVVFWVTAAQLAALRAIVRGKGAPPSAARRDPRWALVERGALEYVPGNYDSARFKATRFGVALVEGLREVKLPGDRVKKNRRGQE